MDNKIIKYFLMNNFPFARKEKSLRKLKFRVKREKKLALVKVEDRTRDFIN